MIKLPWHFFLFFVLTLNTLLAIAADSSTEVPKGNYDDRTSKRVALVIGNSKYLHVPPVMTSANDATDVGEKLKTLGFQVHTVLEADAPTMRKAISDFSNLLKTEPYRDALAVYYFAGHGTQRDGRNFLLPVDFRVERDKAYENTIDVNEDVIRQLSKMARGPRPGPNIVIVDADRDDPLVGRPGFSRIEAPVGTLIAFATATGQQTIDSLDLTQPQRNGLYARFLLEELSNRNHVDVERFFKVLARKVYEASRQRQSPQLMSNLIDDVRFVPERKMSSVSVDNISLGNSAGIFNNHFRERLALVIGNSKYLHIPSLATSANDAVDVGVTLEKLGFLVSAAYEADAATMVKVISDFAAKLRTERYRDAIVVFYYAGHSAQSGGRNFLLPVDVPIGDRTTLTNAIDIGRDVVLRFSVSDSGTRPGPNIIVIDASRDGPLSAKPGLTRMEVPIGTLLAFAAAAGQQAIDTLDQNKSERNSLYASHLLKELTSRNRVDMEKFFKILKRKVNEASMQRQDPLVMPNLIEDVYFEPEGAREKTSVLMATTGYASTNPPFPEKILLSNSQDPMNWLNIDCKGNESGDKATCILTFIFVEHLAPYRKTLAEHRTHAASKIDKDYQEMASGTKKACDGYVSVVTQSIQLRKRIPPTIANRWDKIKLDCDKGDYEGVAKTLKQVYPSPGKFLSDIVAIRIALEELFLETCRFDIHTRKAVTMERVSNDQWKIQFRYPKPEKFSIVREQILTRNPENNSWTYQEGRVRSDETPSTYQKVYLKYVSTETIDPVQKIDCKYSAR